MLGSTNKKGFKSDSYLGFRRFDPYANPLLRSPIVKKRDNPLAEIWLDASQAPAAVAYLEKHNGKSMNTEWNSSWYGAKGGKGADKFLRLMEQGDRERVDSVRDLVRRVTENLDIEGIQPEIDTHVVGFSPCVPAYLEGSPECMFGFEEEDGPQGEIRIFANLTSSCGYSDEQVVKRGTAILALTQALGVIRPVELWVTGAQGCRHGELGSIDTLCAVRLSTAPVDYSQAAAWLCNTVSARGFLYSMNYASEERLIADEGKNYSRGSGGWPNRTDHELVRPGCSDVIVPPLHMDASSACLKDPVKWIDEQVRLCLKGQGAGHESHAAK